MLLSFPQSLSLHHSRSKLNPTANSTSTSPRILAFALRVKNSKPNRPYRQSSPSTSPSREAVAKSAIQRISEKLRNLGYLADDAVPLPTAPGSAGEIFIPTPHEIPNYRVGHTIDNSWSTPEHPVPEPGSGTTINRFSKLWNREGSLSEGKEAKLPNVALLTLPLMELKRLRTLGIALTKRLKVGKVGITEGIVNGIHERWRQAEVVKIACYDICRMNMKRTHEILERKTGGLVIWRSGNIIVLYRGTDYKYPYFHTSEQENLSELVVDDTMKTNGVSSFASTIAENTSLSSSAIRVHSPFVAGVGSPNKLRLQLSGEKQLEEDADRLLDGLGPRFTNWWGYDPLPVDGDLLPEIIPGLRKPFRLLPFGIKPKLTDRELTILRRLSRHLPCHFALGRNRNLQGLAVSIIKLWEKCEIAKIAVKRGVQNTNSEMMAEELKKFTGGTLLSRNKDFFVLYRGKDFLPLSVSVAIEERRNFNSCNKTHSNDVGSPTLLSNCSMAASTGLMDSQVQDLAKTETSLMVQRNAKSASSNIGKVKAKLTSTAEKIKQSEKHLVQLEKLIELAEVESDKEGISEEERYMLWRVGLRMKPYLPLGRRGVFDGTIENMHLHWKYRELVKILCNDQCFENVENIALTLEAESGGILVAIERVSKGYSIIIYRGKNYQRPASLRPKTLLNKREALKRYIEAQRNESLKLHALYLSKTIDRLDCQAANNDSYTKTLHLSEYEGSTFSSDVSENGEPIKVDFGLEPESTNNRSAQSESTGQNIKENPWSWLASGMSHGHGCLMRRQNEKHFVASTRLEKKARRNKNLEAKASLYLCSRKPSINKITIIERVGEVSPEGFHSNGNTASKIGSIVPYQGNLLLSKDEYDHEFEETKQSLEPIGSNIGSIVPYQGNLALSKDEYDHEFEETKHSLEPIGSTFRSTSEEGWAENEQHDKALDATMYSNCCVSAGVSSNSFSAERQSIFCSSSLEKKPDHESVVGAPFRPAPLSNKDRLLLRKQALRMSKRPVLSVGKSNILSGVAKTIKTHFRKHPLAIVNIKGRDKGTSVQELVFELEQATGSVLVSREPNKLILYRGWGEGEEPWSMENKRPSKTSSKHGEEHISHHLVAAIRRECGLPALDAQ
ncbi:hypothetical protein HPP92_010601 [Vanilla planifolia]|uniref:CRM-domain containing factor CFM3, chloroplastic/mitochondrial n=1 Tax=Vanilla planifolia TaxID=51239 RepID=A0A835RAR8_VANPL|nr:hypothetical protein HPP92_010601 [Vanilla planifolia]